MAKSPANHLPPPERTEFLHPARYGRPLGRRQHRGPDRVRHFRVGDVAVCPGNSPAPAYYSTALEMIDRAGPKFVRLVLFLSAHLEVFYLDSRTSGAKCAERAILGQLARREVHLPLGPGAH